MQGRLVFRDAPLAQVAFGQMAMHDADFVVFLLSDRSGVVTGSVIDWDQNVPGAYD